MNDCNELLENIQKSLLFCCNNNANYKFVNPINKIIYPLQCENIINYKRSLNITNIELICIPLTIKTDQEYLISYDCNSRKITINQ
jgi:hypothetical protein